MGRHGNGAWTVFVTERKHILVRRKKYNKLLDGPLRMVSANQQQGD
jgi:hypothetical protein